jgi:hypothetical protein
MPFERFIVERTTKRKKAATSSAAPNSVILPEALYAEIVALAGEYGAEVERIAEEAASIGLRAIKARNDAFNRRVFTPPEPVETT